MDTKKIFAGVIFYFITQTIVAVNINHPCMLHTQSDINRVKNHLTESPWNESYSHLQSSSYASASYTEKTSSLQDGYLKRMDATNWSSVYSDYNNYTAAMKDANAAYQLALRYQISGENEFADAAVAILNAWADNCKGILQVNGYTNNIPDPNEYLINIQAHQFANAAELLRDYDGWNASDFSDFQNWMKSVFYPIAKLFLDNHHGNECNMHYWLNWDLANLTAVLSIGILCDDEEMIDYAINYFKTNTTEVGYIRNAVPYIHDDTDSDESLGQCEESGRDQGHAVLCVGLMGAFCQMAYNIGEDLFAYDNYRAIAMAEYVGKYNLITAETYSSDSKSFVYNSDTFPYTSYSNPSYTNETISEKDRGQIRPVWEIYLGYAKQHEVSAIYSEAWSEMMRNKSGFGSDGGAGDYGTGSGGFDQLGYGTLMYSQPNETDISVEISPTCDVSLRSDKGDNSNSTATTIEMYTVRENNTISKDFIGLMSFEIPKKEGYKVKSASLKLVTERAKGTLAIYDFDAEVSNNDTYNSQSDNIASAREKTAIVTVKLAGTSNKAVTDVGASSTLSDWINTIDLTDYVKSNGYVDMNLLLANNANSTTTSIKVYTSDVTDVTNSNEGFTFSGSDLKPILTLTYEIDEDQKSEVITPAADTYVRMGNTANHGSETTMELYTDLNNNKDFVGLLSFNIPSEALTGEYTIESANLRLVTERCKGVTSISIYNYNNNISESTTYADEETHISEARNSSSVEFNVAYGVRSKSLVSDDISAGSALASWTNNIDITELVKMLTSANLNLMIACADGNANANKFFTKEATDVTNAKDASYTYAATDLVPQLTITYTKAASETKYILTVSSASASTMIIPFDADLPDGVKAYTLDYTSGANEVTATEVTSIEANTPVLINAQAGNYTFNSTGNISSKEKSTTGALTGVYYETIVPEGCYVLQDKGEGPMFYKVASSIKVSPYRAYLTANSSSAKMSIRYSDATGIEAIQNKIYNNDVIYDLSGRVIPKGTILSKGIYIQHGKKIIVK